MPEGERLGRALDAPLCACRAVVPRHRRLTGAEESISLRGCPHSSQGGLLTAILIDT
jgi:hypothetical protein